MLGAIIACRFDFATVFFKKQIVAASGIGPSRTRSKAMPQHGRGEPDQRTKAVKTSRNFGFPKPPARLQQGRDGPDRCEI